MRTAPPTHATFARATAVAGIACLLGIAAPALAQRRNPPVGVPAPRGSGRFIPVLGDGTAREPSIDRAEAVDSPDTLAPHRLQWEVTLAGASTDRIGTLDKQGLEAGAVSLTYALGGGADVSVRSAAWERTRLDLPDTSGTQEASGVGATTVTVGRTLCPATWHGGAARYAAFARFAGARAGPGPSESEFGAMFALGRSLGEAAHVAVGAAPAWVGNALDAGHHLEAAAGLVVSRDVGDHASLWLEGVSVSSGETGRPWLGVVDGGLRIDAFSHLGLTLGASAGRGGGRGDVGALARISLHS